MISEFTFSASSARNGVYSKIGVGTVHDRKAFDAAVVYHRSLRKVVFSQGGPAGVVPNVGENITQTILRWVRFCNGLGGFPFQRRKAHIVHCFADGSFAAVHVIVDVGVRKFMNHVGVYNNCFGGLVFQCLPKPVIAHHKALLFGTQVIAGYAIGVVNDLRIQRRNNMGTAKE